MTTAYCHSVAQILCAATEKLYLEAGADWSMLRQRPLACRVGTGLATYFRVGRAGDMIVFGRKMVASKAAGEDNWLSCREIRRFGYFDSNESLQHLLAHTVCHEFAHLLQARLYKRVRGSVHNKAFYAILSELHQGAYGEQVLQFIVAAAEQANLPLERLASAEPQLPELARGQLIRFKYGDGIAAARVVRLNRKTVSAEPLDEKTPVKYWRIPYGLIEI